VRAKTSYAVAVVAIAELIDRIGVLDPGGPDARGCVKRPFSKFEKLSYFPRF